MAAEPVAAIPGLARKLPHYTRYSYLAFNGDEPENVAKGMWQPFGSPLVRNLTDGDLPELVLPARAPLAELPAVFDAGRLQDTVDYMAQPASRVAGSARPVSPRPPPGSKASSPTPGSSRRRRRLSPELVMDRRRARADHGS